MIDPAYSVCANNVSICVIIASLDPPSVRCLCCWSSYSLFSFDVLSCLFVRFRLFLILYGNIHVLQITLAWCVCFCWFIPAHNWHLPDRFHTRSLPPSALCLFLVSTRSFSYSFLSLSVMSWSLFIFWLSCFQNPYSYRFRYRSYAFWSICHGDHCLMYINP